MKHINFRELTITCCTVLLSNTVFAQNFSQTISDSSLKAEQINPLRVNLNQSGSAYFQMTLLNQTWLRYTQNNPGSMRMNHPESETYDIGLRRTRIQFMGFLSARTFIYFQFGQNNFNSLYNSNTPALPYTVSNRKLAAFFHDALCEYKLSKNNALKIGAGLTIMNGLSRFSQPSISSIATMDLPIFLQYSVDQIDEFDRRLALYARGQWGPLDYRFYVSNPFPVTSNGNAPPAAITYTSQFVNPNLFIDKTGRPLSNSPGIGNQYGGFLSYNVFDSETHTTPYMTGTYLGNKKVCNFSAGWVYQKNAMMRLNRLSETLVDTVFEPMLQLGLETFLDVPIQKTKGTAMHVFAGYYATNYGKNYLRFNGIMNPANALIPANYPVSYLSGSAYGNAYPMFGTGEVWYFQWAYVLPKSLLGEPHGQLMPYASTQYARYEGLQGARMWVWNTGMHWLIKGHQAKISLDYQNRPTYYYKDQQIRYDARKGCWVLQYQLFI